MAKQPNSDLKFSRDYEAVKPMGHTTYVIPIDVRDWKRIKARLERCTLADRSFGGFAWSMFGASVTALFTAFAMHAATPDAPPVWFAVMWCAFGVTASAAALAYIFTRAFGQVKAESLADVLDEIRHVESEFRMTQEELDRAVERSRLGLIAEGDG